MGGGSHQEERQSPAGCQQGVCEGVGQPQGVPAPRGVTGVRGKTSGGQLCHERQTAAQQVCSGVPQERGPENLAQGLLVPTDGKKLSGCAPGCGGTRGPGQVHPGCTYLYIEFQLIAVSFPLSPPFNTNV